MKEFVMKISPSEILMEWDSRFSKAFSPDTYKKNENVFVEIIKELDINNLELNNELLFSFFYDISINGTQLISNTVEQKLKTSLNRHMQYGVSPLSECRCIIAKDSRTPAYILDKFCRDEKNESVLVSLASRSNIDNHRIKSLLNLNNDAVTKALLANEHIFDSDNFSVFDSSVIKNEELFFILAKNKGLNTKNIDSFILKMLEYYNDDLQKLEKVICECAKLFTNESLVNNIIFIVNQALEPLSREEYYFLHIPFVAGIAQNQRLNPSTMLNMIKELRKCIYSPFFSNLFGVDFDEKEEMLDTIYLFLLKHNNVTDEIIDALKPVMNSELIENLKIKKNPLPIQVELERSKL